MTSLLAIIPKRTISGGNIEISRFLEAASQNGAACTVEYFFPSNLSGTHAFFLFPYFLLRILYVILVTKPQLLLLTHYTNFYLALFPFRSAIVLFLQGPEWLFPSPFRCIQILSIAIHSFIFKYVDSFFVGSSYLLHEMQSTFPVAYQKHHASGTIIYYPVGDDSCMYSSSIVSREPSQPRDIDLILILRNGWLKNYPAYIQVLKCLLLRKNRRQPSVVIVNLSSYSLPLNISQSPMVRVVERMSQSELFSLFLRAKTYLSLSLYEGLGLPPLEAMSLGVVPIVLDNGGVHCYLNDFENLILPANCCHSSISNAITGLIDLPPPIISQLSAELAEKAQQYFSVSRATRKKAISSFFRGFQEKRLASHFFPADS